MPSPAPSRLGNPLLRMEIRFDGFAQPGGLKTINGARFGMVRNGGATPHQGVDLYAAPGTPIYAIADGEVVQIRRHDPQFGQAIILKFWPGGALAAPLTPGDRASQDGALYALYGHLSQVTSALGRVRRGQLLGATGVSGNADQRYPHLHLEIRTVISTGLHSGLKYRINPERIFTTIDYSKPVEAVERYEHTA